jgi:hypothetical protein
MSWIAEFVISAYFRYRVQTRRLIRSNLIIPLTHIKLRGSHYLFCSDTWLLVACCRAYSYLWRLVRSRVEEPAPELPASPANDIGPCTYLIAVASHSSLDLLGPFWKQDYPSYGMADDEVSGTSPAALGGRHPHPTPPASEVAFVPGSPELPSPDPIMPNNIPLTEELDDSDTLTQGDSSSSVGLSVSLSPV